MLLVLIGAVTLYFGFRSIFEPLYVERYVKTNLKAALLRNLSFG